MLPTAQSLVAVFRLRKCFAPQNPNMAPAWPGSRFRGLGLAQQSDANNWEMLPKPRGKKTQKAEGPKTPEQTKKLQETLKAVS